MIHARGKDVNRYSFVVGSTYRALDGFTTGRSFLTTQLNQLVGVEVG